MPGPTLPLVAPAPFTASHDNTPRNVTGVTLLSQASAGPVQPSMYLSHNASGIDGDCLGTFTTRVSTRGLHGGITNPAATWVSTPDPVAGPVTLVMQLQGTGLQALNAESIAAGFTTDSRRSPASAAVFFNGAGPSGCDGGFVGSTSVCRTSMYVVGDVRIGNTIEFCQSGPRNCHDCLWLSLSGGPTTIAGIQVAVGFPLLFVYDFGEFDSRQEICQTLTIPNDQMLVGTTIYAAIATFRAPSPTQLRASAPYSFTIRP